MGKETERRSVGVTVMEGRGAFETSERVGALTEGDGETGCRRGGDGEGAECISDGPTFGIFDFRFSIALPVTNTNATTSRRVLMPE